MVKNLEKGDAVMRITLVTCLLALAVSACAAEVQVTPTTSTTKEPTTTTQASTTTSRAPAPTPTTSPELSQETRALVFVNVMREESADYSVVTWVDVYNDSQLEIFGRTICGMFDLGYDVVETYDAGTNHLIEEFTAELMFEADYNLVAYGMGAAIVAFCPEYEWMMST